MVMGVKEIREQFNPANTSECIGKIVLHSIEETEAKIEATERAFQNWSNMSSVARGEILHKMADELMEHMEPLAELASKEMGKTVPEMIGEVKRGASILRYFSQEGMRATGEVLPSVSEDKMIYTKRVPLGVVALITPWNFPIAIPLWKMAPALVYGNTVVWKPSIEVSLTSQYIADLFVKAGLPENVLNIVQGRGSKLGTVLIKSPKVKAVSFTGSNEVGQQILSVAGPMKKKVQLELGGKNAAIILADADLDLAARLTIEGAMKQTGQRCTATSRVYIEAPVYDEVVEKLIEQAKQIKVGETMGPLATKQQLESVLAHIERAKEQGANCILGGERARELPDGYFVEPTLFTDVTHDMDLAREEVFGPVLAIFKVADYEEAIQLSNDTEFGLSASIYTTNIQMAFDFIERSEVGLVQINDETGGAEPQAPFGGLKNSGTGAREQGQAAKEFFTELKTITINGIRMK